MIAGKFQPKVRQAATLAAITASLLISACSGSGNREVNAQMACPTLSGKSIGGATLMTAVVPANARTDHRLTDSPSHCKSQHATSTAGKMPTFIGPTAGDSERLKLAANQKYYRSAVLRGKLA
jgi:hypothetical protein